MKHSLRHGLGNVSHLIQARFKGFESESRERRQLSDDACFALGGRRDQVWIALEHQIHCEDLDIKRVGIVGIDVYILMFQLDDFISEKCSGVLVLEDQRRLVFLVGELSTEAADDGEISDHIL
jgi:hypothetical protein